MRGNELIGAGFGIVYVATFTIPMRGNEARVPEQWDDSQFVYDPHEG